MSNLKASPKQKTLFARLRKWLAAAFAMVTVLVLLVLVWRWVMVRYAARYTFSADDAPVRRVAIVFGAQVYADGTPSAMLRDRIETAVALYRAGNVQKIIMSGDNRFDNYNEPLAMMAYAIERGVPPEDIQPDYAGRRTYDTCYRARDIFQVDAPILVTQKFHLARAIFTCRALGLDAVGVSADRQWYGYGALGWSSARELAASLRAALDVVLRRPAPVLGEPIPVN